MVIVRPSAKCMNNKCAVTSFINMYYVPWKQLIAMTIMVPTYKRHTSYVHTRPHAHTYISHSLVPLIEGQQCGRRGHVMPSSFNTLRPRHNGRHFADDIFCIFLNENVWIPIKISLKFVPKGPINYIPALVQIMAWRRPGDRPLSETMMVRLLTHICVTRPQWVNTWVALFLFSGYRCLKRSL